MSGFAKGARVRARDRESGPWRNGTVTDERDGKAVVTVDGMSRGFTFRVVEPLDGAADAKLAVGARARVRDSDQQAWKEGEVVEMRAGQPVVKVDGQSRGFTWKQVEAAGAAAAAPAAAGAAGPVLSAAAAAAVPALSVGARAKVRDADSESWKEGTVTEMRGGQPVVQVDGQKRGFTWKQVEALPAKAAAAAPAAGAVGAFSVGDRVRVRDSERDPWREGTVTEMRGGRAVVKPDGLSRAFTWNEVEALPSKSASPPAAAAAPAAPSGGVAVGARMRARDSEQEAWKVGTVTELRGGQPAVKIDGHSQAFTWKFTEPLDTASAPASATAPAPAAAPAAAAQLAVGGRARVRDSDKEPWREGTVTEMRGSTPVVKLDGQSRGFTWAQVEPAGGAAPAAAAPAPAALAVGGRARVRDSDKDPWREGTVTEMQGDRAVVKLDGQSRGFTWQQVEPLGAAAAPAPAAAAAGGAGRLAVGDRARVRDSEKDPWREGTVTEMRGDRAVVKLDGQARGFTWAEVEPASGAKGAPPEKAGGVLQVGGRARVRDSEKDPWREGVVTEMRGDAPVVKLDGQSRGFTWTHVEPLAAPPPGAAANGTDAAAAAAALAVAVAGAPAGLREGELVRVRDSEKDDWKQAKVVSIGKDGRAVVEIEGVKVQRSWAITERPEAENKAEATEKEDPRKLRAGDRVRMRDSVDDDWQEGEVTDPAGPIVRCDGSGKELKFRFVIQCPRQDDAEGLCRLLLAGRGMMQGDTAKGTWAGVLRGVPLHAVQGRVAAACGLGHFVAAVRPGPGARKDEARSGLLCWGRNDRGQLGAAMTSDEEAALMLPQGALAGGDDIAQVACGDEHTVVVTAAGGAAVSGDNTHGQLGLGDKRTRRCFVTLGAAPLPAQSPRGAVASPKAAEAKRKVAAGCRVRMRNSGDEAWQHGVACSLSDKGDWLVRCSGSEKELPYSSVERLADIPQAKELELMTDIAVVRLGKEHGLESPKGGAVEAREKLSELQREAAKVAEEAEGNKDTEKAAAAEVAEAAASPRAGGGPAAADIFLPLAGAKVTHAACGDYHTILRTEDGVLWVCGYNAHGQLGLGDNESRSWFHPVEQFRGRAITHLAAGDHHTLLQLQGGEVWGCGHNGDGALGLGDREWRVTCPRGAPLQGIAHGGAGVRFCKAEPPAALGAGGPDEPGKVPSQDEIERTAAAARRRGLTVEAVTPSSLADDAGVREGMLLARIDQQDIRNVAEADAIMRDTLRAHQLCFTLPDTRNRPVYVRIPALTGQSIRHLVCGYHHTVAVCSDGGPDRTLVAGRNSHGQLGLGDRQHRYKFCEVTDMTGQRIQAVGAGRGHTVLLTDGALWVCGASARGQLGAGSTTDDQLRFVVTLSTRQRVVGCLCRGDRTLLIQEGKELPRQEWGVTGAAPPAAAAEKQGEGEAAAAPAAPPRGPPRAPPRRLPFAEAAPGTMVLLTPPSAASEGGGAPGCIPGRDRFAAEVVERDDERGVITVRWLGAAKGGPPPEMVPPQVLAKKWWEGDGGARRDDRDEGAAPDPPPRPAAPVIPAPPLPRPPPPQPAESEADSATPAASCGGGGNAARLAELQSLMADLCTGLDYATRRHRPAVSLASLRAQLATAEDQIADLQRQLDEQRRRRDPTAPVDPGRW